MLRHAVAVGRYLGRNAFKFYPDAHRLGASQREHCFRAVQCSRFQQLENSGPWKDSNFKFKFRGKHGWPEPGPPGANPIKRLREPPGPALVTASDTVRVAVASESGRRRGRVTPRLSD
jgi:hypothetical protein